MSHDHASHAGHHPSGLYGVMAEFEEPSQLVHAAAEARKAGYRNFDAYSPMPVHGIDDAMGIKRTKLPMLVLLAGITGLVGGFSMEYFSSVVHYPLNIGGKPLNSWPMFIPPAYELTILFAAYTTGLGMLLFNGMPAPYHPVFNVPAFARASSDRFFLCIEAVDPLFEREKTTAFLNDLHPREVSEVAP